MVGSYILVRQVEGLETSVHERPTRATRRLPECTCSAAGSKHRTLICSLILGTSKVYHRDHYTGGRRWTEDSKKITPQVYAVIMICSRQGLAGIGNMTRRRGFHIRHRTPDHMSLSTVASILARIYLSQASSCLNRYQVATKF